MRDYRVNLYQWLNINSLKLGGGGGGGEQGFSNRKIPCSREQVSLLIFVSVLTFLKILCIWKDDFPTQIKDVSNIPKAFRQLTSHTSDHQKIRYYCQHIFLTCAWKPLILKNRAVINYNYIWTFAVWNGW